MERRFAARMQEALEAAVVDPRVFRDVQPRLEKFLEPFVACLHEAEQKMHAQNYVTGLLSDLKRKTSSRSPTCTTRIGCLCRSSSVVRPGSISPC